MLRLIVLGVMLLVGTAPLRADVIHLDSAGLHHLLTTGVAVVDIRRPDEWSETGVIEGSHLLTFFDAEGRYDLGRWLPALAAIAEPEEPVVIICHSGERSGRVARYLDRRTAYTRVFNARLGISNWIAEDRPTVGHR